MEIIGVVKSIVNNKDVFNNFNPWTEDHVWPRSKGGSNSKINLIKLSSTSNELKGSNTSGIINGIKYSVLRQTGKSSSGDEIIFGVLFILENKDKNQWLKVIR